MESFLQGESEMKGRLILVLLLLFIVPVVYMALRDTNADLYRKFELLENIARAVEESLEKTLEPHEKVQSLKLTQGKLSIRLTNQRNRLMKRVKDLRKAMKSLLLSIDQCTSETKADTARTLEKTRETADLILRDFNEYAVRVDLIAFFMGEQIPLVNRIGANLEQLNFFKSKRMGIGTPIPKEFETRLDKVTADFRKSQRNCDDTVEVAWGNVDQAKVFAGVTVNDLRKCLSLSETLLADMNLEMESGPFLLQRHRFLVDSAAVIGKRLGTIGDPLKRLRAAEPPLQFDAEIREYKEEIRKLGQLLDVAGEGVKAADDKSRASLSATLWKIMAFQDNLSAEVDAFCRKIESIDSFLAEREKMHRAGALLIDAINEVLGSRSDSLPPEQKEKAKKAIAEFDQTLRSTERIPAEIRKSLRKGNRSAGWAVQEMQNRLAALETVIEELSGE